jgi:hypothetical protein
MSSAKIPKWQREVNALYAYLAAQAHSVSHQQMRTAMGGWSEGRLQERLRQLQDQLSASTENVFHAPDSLGNWGALLLGSYSGAESGIKCQHSYIDTRLKTYAAQMMSMQNATLKTDPDYAKVRLKAVTLNALVVQLESMA